MTGQVASRGKHAIPMLPTILVAYIVVEAILIISSTGLLSEDQSWLAVSVPLSHSSLAAIWAATQRTWDVSLRCLVAITGCVSAWTVISQILPWGFGDPASSVWAAAIFVQTFGIVLLIGQHQLFWRSQRVHSSFTFGLRTLMVWTATFAIGFTFIRVGQVGWGWSAAAFQSIYFIALALTAVSSATLTALVTWFLFRESTEVGLVAKLYALTAASACLVLAAPHIIAWATSVDSQLCRELVIDYAVLQNVIVLGVLGLYRIGTSHASKPA